MKYWLISSEEPEKELYTLDKFKYFAAGDKIVLLSKGIVTKILELKPAGGKEDYEILHAPPKGLVARPLWNKANLQKPLHGTSSLHELSAQEFGKVELAIAEKKKELIF